MLRDVFSGSYCVVWRIEGLYVPPLGATKQMSHPCILEEDLFQTFCVDIWSSEIRLSYRQDAAPKSSTCPSEKMSVLKDARRVRRFLRYPPRYPPHLLVREGVRRCSDVLNLIARVRSLAHSLPCFLGGSISGIH